jgi:hypothetical protein
VWEAVFRVSEMAIAAVHHVEFAAVDSERSAVCNSPHLCGARDGKNYNF